MDKEKCWERFNENLIEYEESANLVSKENEELVKQSYMDSLDGWIPVSDDIADLIKDASVTDGAHHKQWFVEEIARRLKIELPEHESGICP